MITRGCAPGFGEVLFDTESSLGIHRTFSGLVKKCSSADIDEILAFQQEVVSLIPNPDLFQAHDRAKLEEDFKKGYDVVAVYNVLKNKFVAIMIFYHPSQNQDDNLALDAGLTTADMLKTCVISVVAVHPDYRGLGIQRYLLKLAEKMAIEDGATFLTATVSPINKHSLQNFLDKSFEIRNEKIKYGGKNRYIVMKTLN